MQFRLQPTSEAEFAHGAFEPVRVSGTHKHRWPVRSRRLLAGGCRRYEERL